MFKKTRKKIVATVMSVLVLLWVGTLGVIYTSSYFQMKQQNRQMLQAHTDMYTLPQNFEGLVPPDKPDHDGDRDGDHGFKPGFDPNSPHFQLSTFYSVAVSYDGKVLDIKNDSSGVYSDQALSQAAADIIADGAVSGTLRNLTFLKTDKYGYYLVAFMDNTVVNENAVTLFRYTLIFGGAALVLFFFLSIFLARKIVAPLEESDQKQRQFISDAGHELKTPISVIGANAELLSRELGESQWLQNIQYENQRMGTLVTQLLDLARTENAPLRTARLDFSRLVSGEALPFENVAFEKGLALNTQITGNILLDGNSAQLKQLISILLDNAIRHSNAAGQVQLTLTREHGAVALSVVNPGNEIPSAQREQIFERFYRVDPVRNSEDKHYGLGLAIAKAIVNAHHGHMEVHCSHGLVEFRVILPTAGEK